jgi:hypothetical protein
MRYVVVPQAVRRVIPPLLNDFIGLQKDTALVALIGPVEAFRQSQIEVARSFDYTPYFATAILFIEPGREGRVVRPDRQLPGGYELQILLRAAGCGCRGGAIRGVIIVVVPSAGGSEHRDCQHGREENPELPHLTEA